MQLVTHQTGPGGQKVRRLLVEEGADIRKELYVGMVVDRGTQRVVLMASSEGGMDIEEVAAKTPEKIHKVFIDPATGLTDAEADDVARKIGVPEASVPQARAVLQGLYRAFDETDASLAEINPLVSPATARWSRSTPSSTSTRTRSSAIPRSSRCATSTRRIPPRSKRRNSTSRTSRSTATSAASSTAPGLAMATMDMIKLYGGEPANFLDVGGGATAEKVTEAFKIMLRNPKLKAILVNIFGGIMKCDTIAEGVVAASKAVSLKVPLVVRMKGTNEDLGRKILADSGLPIITANNMAEAAEKVVAAAKGTIRDSDDVDPGQQGHQGHHAGHHRQDRPVPHADVPRLRQRHATASSPASIRRRPARTSRASRSTRR